jgi:hypothetical protein
MVGLVLHGHLLCLINQTLSKPQKDLRPKPKQSIDREQISHK